MGWQAGRDAGAEVPLDGARDPRLAGFGQGGPWDLSRPSGALAGVVEEVAGAGWRCPGATADEMLGVLRRVQALESWAAGAKLGVLRALVRADDEPLPGGGYHGDLPEGWSKSLTHEVALALAMPVVSADKMMWVAWDLQARLPGIGGLLAAGELTYAKAKVVHEVFLPLSDENAARAEAMILPELPGKTFSQVKRLAEQAAIAVDPDAAARRRQEAERNRARVEMFREDSGAVALSGRDLPTDQTLAAHAHVCALALEYKDSGAFPGGVRMDQYRATAYLDLLNGTPAWERIAAGELVTIIGSSSSATGAGAETRESEAGGTGEPAETCADSDPGDGFYDGRPEDDGPEPGSPAVGGPEPGGPGGQGPGGGCLGDPGGDSPGAAGVVPARRVDLVLPLATVLGRSERPGESHGLGSLDPALCRELALAAVGSQWTRVCVTVTDAAGVAIGHGCAKVTGDRSAGDRTGLALPAQVNLTITAAGLTELATDLSAGTTGAAGTSGVAHPPGDPGWSFVRVNEAGPPGGFGVWILALPDGRRLTVGLEPVPTFECDHRHESHAYQPNDRLRHLVQVRDCVCTFPTCNRHARESDFEHALPYDQGGRTCACNAGARSRACHRVKQSPGWKVTQPKPGWHLWQAPSGRGYTQAPKRYPS